MWYYWRFNVLLLQFPILHDRYRSRRSKSRSLDHGSERSKNSENNYRRNRHSRREKVHEKQQSLDKEEYKKANSKDDQRRKNRFNYADSDESVDTFEERSKDREHGRRSRRPRSQDSNRKTGVRNANYDDSKNTLNETDEDWSSGDRDKDGHRHRRRNSNGRVSVTSKTTDGSPSRSIINDHDIHGISSDRNKEKHLAYDEKRKKHWDEVTKDSDDQLQQKSKLKTDFESKKSNAEKFSSRHFESSSRDLNTEDGYSIDSLHSDVLSDESQEPSISDRYVERIEPLDHNEYIKEGRWDPQKRCDEFEKSSETTSSMRYESGSPVPHGERSKSDVLGIVDYHGNKVNKRNRRKLRSSDSCEHRKSRRKSSRYDDDQNFSDLKSENTNLDGDYLQKSPRSTSHSRTKRHRHS